MEQSDKEFEVKNFFVPFTSAKAIHFLIIIGIVVFCNMLFNNFVLEDRALILRNPSIQSLRFIPQLFIGQVGGQETITYYRPVLFTVYSLLYSLFGQNQFFYHFVQLLLQIGNSILLFIIFKKFFKINLAFFLSVLFLVHPMNEETTVWITNFQEVLYLFFGLLGLLLSMRKEPSISRLILVNFLLFLSLLSKETGILFFALVLLYLYYFQEKYVFTQLMISAAFGIIYIVLRLIAHVPLDKEPLVPIMTLSFLERLVQIPAIIFYYLQTFFFPKDLVVYHSWIIRSIQFSNFYLPLLLDSFFFILLGYIGLNTSNKTRESKLAWFFIFWFAAGLLFHLQLFPLDLTVADHFFIFSFIGLLGIIGIFLQETKLKFISKSIAVSIGIVLIVGLSLRTMVRNINWQNQTTILSHDEKESPNDYLLELVYSTDLIQNNKIDEAEKHIKKALELYPNSSRAWSSLGVIYFTKGQIPQAKYAFLKSIAIDNYFGAYENLGLLYTRNESPQNALAFLRKATQKYPNSQRLWYYRFLVSYKLKNYDEALMSAKFNYLLSPTDQNYAIYTHLLQKEPINIE